NTKTMLEAASRFAPRMGQSASRMLGFIAHAAATGELELDSVARLTAKLSGGDRPRRQQILPLQLMAEVAVVLGREDVAQLALRNAADIGLIDLYWLDACPVCVSVGATTWFAEIRSDVRAFAANVLASFRAATAG